MAFSLGSLPPSGVRGTLSSANGFTVLELMIALVILGLGLAALSHALTDSVTRTQRAAIDERVAQTAENVLNRLGVDIPLTAGVRTGRAGDIDWRLNIEPYGSDADRQAWIVAPVDVTLDLRWLRGRTQNIATWHTLRAVPKSEQSR
jgi:prepilin-type N-terminal cleavage/methylation domain-containing protein